MQAINADPIATPYIQLDQFLKWIGVVDSGGQAKELVAAGLIRVNGELVHERRKKLYPGDNVKLEDGTVWTVTAS